MRFERLNLNLLVALDALLTERSVSLAAEKLCLSQSATSSALGNLREYFGDELLVVKGRCMIPTVRAEQLIEPVRAVLEQIRTTIAVTLPFELATDERHIAMMASDYVTEVLLSDALVAIQRKAPGLRFEILPMSDNPVDMLDCGNIDLLVTPDYAISVDHPSKFLFEDDFVVIGWKENPAMHEVLTREAYFRLGHVTARFGQARIAAFDDWFVRRQKQKRRVEVVAPAFLSLGQLVANTNRIATVHRRMAEIFVDRLPLVIRETPFAIPPIREAVQWHVRNDNDAALRWVVERLEAAAQRAQSEATNIIAITQVERTDQARDRMAFEWENSRQC